MLPIAMSLGLAETLTRKIKAVYGDDFLAEYKPAWYRDFENSSSFDGGRLLNQLNEIFTFNSYRPAIDLRQDSRRDY